MSISVLSYDNIPGMKRVYSTELIEYHQKTVLILVCCMQADENFMCGWWFKVMYQCLCKFNIRARKCI